MNYTDFMCSCKESGKVRCEETLQRVLKEVTVDGDPGDLLTAVVYGLQWGLPNDCIGCGLEFGCDQWAGISLTVMRMDSATNKYVDHAEIWVQCEIVEHGLARVWELAKEAATLRVEVSDAAE